MCLPRYLFIEAGRLMARYCIAYDSMKQLLTIKGKESLSDMVIKKPFFLLLLLLYHIFTRLCVRFKLTLAL